MINICTNNRYNVRYAITGYFTLIDNKEQGKEIRKWQNMPKYCVLLYI